MSEETGPSPEEMGLDDITTKQQVLEAKSKQLNELVDWVKRGEGTSDDRELINSLRNEVGRLKSELEPQAADKPKFEIGTKVSVRRSSGEIEDDWEIGAYHDGNYIVVKLEGKGLMKPVPQAELEALQEEQKIKNTSES